jgi:hypothetical protein
MDQPREIRLTDPEVVVLVNERAAASGRTVEEVVKAALRSDAALPLVPATGRRQDAIEARLALLRDISGRAGALTPGITSNHDWPYDENGLPK